MSIRFPMCAALFALASASTMAATVTPPSATPIAPVPLQITIYEKPEFKGATLVIYKAIPDLAPLKFDNKVGSLVIAGSGDWVLCEHKDYKGRCARVQSQAANLKLFNLNDRVSSLYPAPVDPPATPAAKPN